MRSLWASARGTRWGRVGDSSRALPVLREFFFVPSVLKSLSSMTERQRLNKITESDVTAFKEHSL